MEQNAIAQVFTAHLALIGTDIQAWSDLLAEDAIVEFPYAAALGMPDRFEGKPAIYDYIFLRPVTLERTILRRCKNTI
jgi:uncharacterized protein